MFIVQVTDKLFKLLIKWWAKGRVDVKELTSVFDNFENFYGHILQIGIKSQYL
jgi:hypothetical protein